MKKMPTEILNMDSHTKNRDLIIRFCIVGRFTLDEINRALKLYGMSPLYAKDKRDACIIVAVIRKKYDLFGKMNRLRRHWTQQYQMRNQ